MAAKPGGATPRRRPTPATGSGWTGTAPADPGQRKGGPPPPDIDKLVEACRTVACTPEETVTLLERAQDTLGLTHCDCTFFFGGVTYEQAQRSLGLFSNEVIPRLKDRAPSIED